MDPTIGFADLDVIRRLWPGKIAVKGVQNVDDARRLADLGVDGIVLSNHGGRQLDRAQSRSTCCLRSLRPSVAGPKSPSTPGS